MIKLPKNYSEKIENIVKEFDINFEMIKYSETKKVEDEIFGYFNLLKEKIVGGIYVYINKKGGEIKFGEPIINGLNFDDELKLNRLEEKIAKELGFLVIKVEVLDDELRNEFIKKGYKFKSEKIHIGVKELK